MSIPAAIFKRRRTRGGEPGASARYSVRRAGGGSSLMARSRSGRGAGRFLPPAARRDGVDRISALSDDLLLLVLRRLDTRSALAAGSLSRRWAHLPRELPALDLSAGDILPPRYHRWVLFHRDCCRIGIPKLYRSFFQRELRPNIRRYERRAMRTFTRAMESFLDERPPPRSPRRVSQLRLEFFVTGAAAAGSMNRLIAEAIDAWGVEELEAVAKPPLQPRGVVHSFPSHCLCRDPRASRLRSLKLGGCFVPPPLHGGHSALATLVLQSLPESTPPAAYERIFTSCPQLRTLHLVSCSCRDDNGEPLKVTVDAPSSEIRELVVDSCKFASLLLRSLPCLESLASLGCAVFFESSSSSPCLRQWNLTRYKGVILVPFRQYLPQLRKLDLDRFLGCTPEITSLMIRFTGPDRWIVPEAASPCSFLPRLKRLLVADVPSSWDVSWPRLLLEMAPSLEVLHISIAAVEYEPGEEISWQPGEVQLHHLKEFVVAGFQGTARQIYLVKFVVGACTVLRRVAMFKDGHARDKGHWDWEMVTQQRSWTDEEKDSTLRQIMDGISSSTAPLMELILS
ncbi:hypothetical protein ACP70R_030176 [Stipagrostis hirtigluma subsp. patula]